MTDLPPVHLFAATRPLAEAPELLSFADARNPLVWLRGGQGYIGIGETVRLVFRGADRFNQAAKTWQRIAAAASVDDPLQLPGTGLIAFGSFAFADDSTLESVLIVPRLLLARHGNTAWVTRISRSKMPDTIPNRLDPKLWGAASDIATWNSTKFDVSKADTVYLDGVRAAVMLIERGTVEKIVLSRRVHGRIHADADLRTPLARLATRYLDCHTYAIDGMIGSSPEMLIRQRDGQLTARVLAGTRGRRSEPSADRHERDELLTHPKEQQEHAFAVRSVVASLTPHVRELRVSERPFALQLPNVWHLATDLTAVPAGSVSSLTLAGVLHPTAAVAGTPTRAAVAAIAQLEPFDRGRYAGASGWLNAAGDGEWVIALRCAHVAAPSAGSRTVTAYAGGGIVAGSSAEHELRETISKFRPIVEAFS